MITEISRTLTGKYIYANTSIIFDSNPYLTATNDLTLYFTDNDARYAAKVVSVSANSAVVNFSNPQYNNRGITIKTPNFGSGVSGAQETWSFKFTTPPNAILQAFSSGGSSNVSIQASTDDSHWVTLANLSITSASSNTAYTTVTSPWPYGRLYISDIDAGNSINVNKVI